MYIVCFYYRLKKTLYIALISETVYYVWWLKSSNNSGGNPVDKFVEMLIFQALGAFSGAKKNSKILQTADCFFNFLLA